MMWATTLALGVWGTSAQVGIYTTAYRTSMLTSFILIAVNTVAAPKYAEYYSLNQLNRLEDMALSSVKIMCFLALPPLIVFMVFPHWIMGLFGSEFMRGGRCLSILACGQFINVATGSVGYILMMSGHENLLRNAITLSGTLNVILNLWMVPKYNIIGGAIATAISLATLNMTRRLFRLDGCQDQTSSSTFSQEPVLKDSMNPPVIIIGMHRSGTSLVARLLDALGLFLGKYKDENHEARLFISINDWFLRIAGGAWDNPNAIDRLLNNHEARRAILKHTIKTMDSLHRIRYSGFKYFYSYKKSIGYNIPWGWKDPRNTITLPLWLELFPEAKIIHICRHGVDVAQSLCSRQGLWINRARTPNIYRRAKYLIRPFGGIYLRSVGFQEHAEGLGLWDSYMQRAKTSMLLLKNQAIEIRYEDLLQEPEMNVRRLNDFCQLKNDSQNISEALKIIRPVTSVCLQKKSRS